MKDSERIFEIIWRQTGALPALADSTEFAFTAKGVIIQWLFPLSPCKWRCLEITNPDSRNKIQKKKKNRIVAALKTAGSGAIQ